MVGASEREAGGKGGRTFGARLGVAVVRRCRLWLSEHRCAGAQGHARAVHGNAAAHYISDMGVVAVGQQGAPRA